MSTPGPDDPPADATVESGTVRWFDERRGYGFIAREAAVDVFFHASAVRAPRPLAPGDRVSFEVAEAPRGLQARSIHLVSATMQDEVGTSGEPPA